MSRASDLAGLAGVAMILFAYAGVQLGRLDPMKGPSLLLNLAGACLILVSLLSAFNLAAFLMEAAWAAIALFGLIRLALKRS
ncbi:MAG: CBU_0592 family membrane protein [Caulobacteraceae bacterium]